ncbi:mitochondrial protein [Ephemerocybe angulata]|uniref:Mitochondrial protein n=1 Tax=Ephemerocybe angulata TaxID=980116 RepID=A0A8H6MEC1_9AGAR|nr:mitochondrial protein [Tulosesus angulatus]
MPPAIVHTLLHRAPTVAQVANRALLSVTGTDANTFLNGVLSTPVKGPHYTAFLHSQGRVLYDAFIYNDPAPTTAAPSYIVEYSPPPPDSPDTPPLLAYLKRHVLRSKVKVRDVSEQYDIWASWGAEVDSAWETKRAWNWARSRAVEPVWNLEIEDAQWPWGVEAGVIRDRRAVGMGRRLLVRKGDMPNESSTHDLGTPEDYLLHRVLHGVPEGNIDIPPAQAFPMDSNIDIMGGVDFRKGCYVGQELTVRTYHTGVIRKRIHPVFLHTGSPSSGPQTFTSALPAGLDVKPVVETSPDGERKGPRPRGTGKLLSTTTQGVGLALLRLEHVSAARAGALNLQVTNPLTNEVLSVSPWIPSWWPEPENEDTST